MIKLGKMTDYAVTLLVQLSREESDIACSAPELALKTGISEPAVSKVLKQLARAGLLESSRGAAGGYKLAQDPAALSVCSVIEAIEGPISIVACVEGLGEGCKAEGQCPAKGRWDPVNAAIRNALQELTLADMARGSRGMRPSSAPRPIMPAPLHAVES